MNALNTRHTLIAIGICTALGSQAVLAQTAGNTEREEKDVRENPPTEEVVVTGSRIKRSEFDLPVPAQALTLEDLDVVGANELSEAIVELPAVSAGVTTESSQNSTQNSGSSTISLRNLGSERTLTLIDGRRTVGNTSSGSTISLSSIPDAFVERVEVITGGASALYGSDAVTGVVNVITRDDFDGVTFESRVGFSEEGGNEETGFELAVGANLDDDRGNVMFSIEYDQESPIREYQRDKAMVSLALDANTNGNPDELEPNLSSIIPGGLFVGNEGTAADPDRDTRYWFYENGGTGPLANEFETDVHGYNALGVETISIPRKRLLAAGKFTFDITDNVQYFASAHYSWVHTKSERVSDTASSERLGADFPLYLSDGETPHPFVPQPIFDDAIELGRNDVGFRRRWSELGNRFREADNDTFRFWTGVNGEFGDTWSYEVNVGYGQWRRAQSRVGDMIVPNYLQAINVEYVDADDPSQGLRCANEYARDAGCVPLNVFGLGAVSPEQVNWLILRDQLHAKNATTTASAWMTGDLIDLWAGPVSVAAGLDYRHEKNQSRWDPISTSGGGTVSQQVNQDGEQDVREAFLELVVPLVTDLPLVQSFSVEGAIRYSDYSTIGSVSSWKFGGTWQIDNNVAFRSVFARANRAPNNIELFSRGIGGQGRLADPCNGVTTVSEGRNDETCRQDPIISQIIAEQGRYSSEGSTQVYQPNFGNGELFEETADTLTTGVVLSPTFVPGLNLSVDYFDISIAGAIGEISSDDILRLCYNSGDFSNTEACGLPIRDSATGFLQEVGRTSLNLNELRSRGIDYTASYRLNLRDSLIPVLNQLPGRINVSATFSRVIEQEEEAPVPGTNETFVSNRLGLLRNPQNRGRIRLTWKKGPLKVSWRSRFVGEMLNDGIGRDRSIACAEYDNCGDKIALNIGSEWTHNLRLSYRLRDVLDGDTQLYFGVNNITNNQGPQLYGWGNVGENHSGSHDITGRFFYSGVRMKF